MSATYTLHLPRRGVPGDPRALERAILVRDGFSWGAFLVPALWFIRHGHWLLALGAALAVGGLGFALGKGGAGPGTILLAEILLHALLGLEGASLRRFAYELRGRPVADVVTAGNAAEAETRAFARFLADGPPPLPARAPSGFAPPFPPPYPRREPEPVIGLFPDPEPRR